MRVCKNAAKTVLIRTTWQSDPSEVNGDVALTSATGEIPGKFAVFRAGERLGVIY